MKAVRAFCMLFVLTLVSNLCSAQKLDSTVRFSLDPLLTENKYLLQPLSYSVQKTLQTVIRLQCYQYRGKDSICIYDIAFDNIALKKGIHRLLLNLERNAVVYIVDYSFLEAVKKFNQLPSGDYATVITIQDKTHLLYKDRYFHSVDSVLPPYSALKQNLNSPLTADKKSEKLVRQAKNISPVRFDNKKIRDAAGMTNKRASRLSGVTSSIIKKDNRIYNALYYQGWFMGYYEQQEKKLMQANVLQESELLQSNPASFMQTDVSSSGSVSSQFRRMKAGQRKETETEANLEMVGNFSNGQEPASAQDNNYSEYRGSINTEILKIPVTIEGYYTTQDKNRQAKAGYFRIRYDAEKQKKKLEQTVSGYKSSYEQVQSKSGSAKYIGQAALSKIQSEKAIVLDAVRRQYGLTPEQLTKFGKTDGQTASGSDSSTEALRAKREDILKQYRQVEELEKQATIYQRKLAQYNEQDYFENKMSYSKVSNVADDPQASSMQLANAARHILPESSNSRLLAGLTRLDIGILNSYESRYTMSGQALKGGTVGYNLGMGTVSLSAGKTEYISRAGQVDRYNTYMARVDFKRVHKQKIGIIYYTYTPTRQILEDSRFKKTDIALPVFNQPVHIFSFSHEGAVAQFLTLETEAALSYKPSTRKDALSMDHAAIKTSLRYDMPRIAANLTGEWEHVGRNFENNAMPYMRAAIERYALTGKKMLLKSMLTAGVQLNYIQQQNFANTAYSVRWGFDAQTRWKQYPSLYLSYKPFTTFRRYDDTLTTQQRPLTGEVWLARSSYQIKRGATQHRFMVSYNRNNSSVDTMQYLSESVQTMYMYTTLKYTLSGSLGWIKQPMFSLTDDLYYTQAYMVGISMNMTLSPVHTINAGQDVSVAAYGIQRYSISAGTSYAVKRISTKIFIQARYSMLKATEIALRQRLWNGQIGLNWQIKTKKI